MHDKLPIESDLIHQAQTNRDLIEGYRSFAHMRGALTPNIEPVYGFRSEALPTSVGDLALLGEQVDEAFRENTGTNDA